MPKNEQSKIFMRNVTEQINKKGEVSYLIRISVGYNMQGAQMKKSLTWKPSPGMTEKQIKKESEKQAIMFEDKVRNGGIIDGNIKFGEYAEKWLEIKKSDHAPITHTRYKNLLIRINQAIGHIKISKLQSMHLHEFYKSLQSVISKKTGEALSPQTIKHYHLCISAILTTATRERIIPFNVASRQYMDAPKVPNKTPAHLNDEEAVRFVSLLQDEPDIRTKTALTLLIYSGCRLGELCGFSFSDCDFQNYTVRVNKTSQFCSGYGTFEKAPKNSTSKRTIQLSKYVFDILSEYRAWQFKRKFECGDKWEDSGRLFTQIFGKPIVPTEINKWLKRFIKKHDFPHITPHSLRHTFVTLMISNGVDIRTVASKAGHSRTSTTLDLYSHAIQANEEKAAAVIDSVLTPKLLKA